MRKRISIVLPETTIEAIDRMARRGQRSEFINEAVKHFLSRHSAEAMRTQLEAAIIRDRDLDREIAADWFAVDAEAWRRLDIQERKTDYPRRGEIYLTALDPTLGREIQKTRPCLIIQAEISNRLSDLTIVAPITSSVRFPLNPLHVLLTGNESTGLWLLRSRSLIRFAR